MYWLVVVLVSDIGVTSDPAVSTSSRLSAADAHVRGWLVCAVNRTLAELRLGRCISAGLVVGVLEKTCNRS